MNDFLARRPALAVFLPAWVAFVLYLPTLGYGFVWDDVYFLVDSTELRDPALWWRTLSKPLFVSRDYFRPLPLAMFALEARIGATTPFVFHLGNILLHALNTALVVLLARGLIARTALRLWPASLAGVLYAAHPALVENVAWISDRFDLLMTSCLLGALLAQARIGNRWRRAVVIAVLFFAAMLSKETSVVLLALWPLWTLFLALWAARARHSPEPVLALTWRPLWQAHGATAGMLMLTFACYLLVRWLALGYLYVGDAQMAPGNALQHLLLIARTLGWYFLLALWPFGQTNPAHPTVTPLPVTDPLAWLALTVIVAMAFLIARQLWRQRGATPLSLVALAVVTLAPVSNVVPLTIGDNLVSDRYLIVPVALLALATGLWLSNESRRWPKALVSLGCLACALASWQQMPAWRDNPSLWQAAVARAPTSRVARQNLLAALVTDARYAETEQLARTWLRDGDAPPSVRHNLALALAHQGQLAEAETILLALLDHPVSGTRFDHLARSETLNLLAFTRLQAARPGAALTPLRAALQLTPDAARPYFHLALASYALDDIANGDAALREALRHAHGGVVGVFRRKGEDARRAALTRADKRSLPAPLADGAPFAATHGTVK